MSLQLTFDRLLNYEAGQAGITIEVVLRLSRDDVPFTLSVSGFELDALVGFAEDDAFQRNVLGRRGFMEQMVLGLVDYEGQLYLSRYGEE